ncbi:MAG: hypothetical protein WBG92_11930 [Thiohalocapsa sp.]
MANIPDGMISVEEFGKFKGIAPATIVGMIREGFYVGQKVGDEWFVDRSELEGKPNEGQPKKASKPSVPGSSAKSTDHQGVVVTDIQMPFGSMVVFMVKWVIASIPALIILFVLFTIASALGGILIGFGTRATNLTSSVF